MTNYKITKMRKSDKYVVGWLLYDKKRFGKKNKIALLNEVDADLFISKKSKSKTHYFLKTLA